MERSWVGKGMIGNPRSPKGFWGRLGLLAALGALLACSDKSTEAGPAGNALPIPFDSSVDGLPEALPMGEITAHDGDTVRLTVSYVAKLISGRKVRMLAYNGSVPGPVLKIPQGAGITLLLKNETNLPTTL